MVEHSPPKQKKDPGSLKLNHAAASSADEAPLPEPIVQLPPEGERSFHENAVIQATAGDELLRHYPSFAKEHPVMASAVNVLLPIAVAVDTGLYAAGSILPHSANPSALTDEQLKKGEQQRARAALKLPLVKP